MALLSVQTVSTNGTIGAAPTQLAAWASPDTINAGDIGDQGVIAEVRNTSGGSLDLRVGDPGTTPAGSPAVNGYETLTVANNATGRFRVTQANVNPATGVAQIGASTTNAAFTVTVYR